MPQFESGRPAAFVLASLAFVASYTLTAAVRSYALRHDVLDRPNDRSSHTAPTPRGGGIAIVVVTAAALVFGAFATLVTVRDGITMAVGMLCLGAVGWVDDRSSVRASVRLGVHVVVALGTVIAFHGLPALRMGHASVAVGFAGYLLAVLGIVWSINLVNFMDGIDGLAGSQTVLIFGGAGALLFMRGSPSLGMSAFVLAASSAGFLVWNWPPAKIFMGDAGSGSIGYAMATLAVASENRGSVPLIAFAIIGGVFIADATVTLLRRIMRGKRPAAAHRDHAYQRLSRLWASHLQVTWRAAVFTLLLIAFGALATVFDRLAVPAFVVAYLLLATALVATERRAPM
jgi:Fuc2NAc and GlcNAc transferase